MKIRATIEFELDHSYGLAEDDLLWLENEVLVGDGNLILHSNDIGDIVGVIKKVRNIQYLPNEVQDDKRSVATEGASSNTDDIKKDNYEYERGNE